MSTRFLFAQPRLTATLAVGARVEAHTGCGGSADDRALDADRRLAGADVTRVISDSADVPDLGAANVGPQVVLPF